MQGFPNAINMNVAPQQSTISNITVGTSASTSAPKTLTSEAVGRQLAAARKKSEATYWQVAKPTRTLQLTGAVAYVNKNHANRQMNDHFVYWPNFRVAGTVSDIVNTFRAANIVSVDLQDGRGNQPLTEQLVIANSYDPLNPEHRARIDQMQKQGPSAGTGAKKNSNLHTLEQYVIIGNALKEAGKNRTTSTTGGKSSGAATGKGGNSPQAKQQSLVQKFNQIMATALSLPSGMNSEKVFEVTEFDVSKFSKAPTKAPPKTSKATAIQPVLNVQGRQVLVPIIAQSSGANNFRAFVASVVGASPQFSQFAQPIQQAFDQEIQRRSVAIGTQGFVAPQQGNVMSMIQQPAFPQQSFATLPQAGFQQAAIQLPPLNMMGQIGGATSQTGSPTSYGLASPAPVSLGGGSPRGLGVTLPRVNMNQLPGVSGFNPLPSVVGGGSSFPSMTLPMQGISPSTL